MTDTDHDDQRGDQRGDRRGDDELTRLIEHADLDGLIRLVDECSAAHDWPHLLRLRNRARAAVATGRQLWPAATLAEYRLALWAPAQWAATVLDEGSGRFAIGPLTEVVAQRHTFHELHPLLADGPRVGFVAHERALRGEAIDPGSVVNVFEIPFEHQTWEPAYCLATYGDEGVSADPPDNPAADAIELVELANLTDRSGTPTTLVDDNAVELAVRQLVEAWTTASNGRAEVVCVEGDARLAIAALGLRQARMAPISAAEAMRWMAWAGASGGAMARRRGAAIGRFGAWWTATAITDLADDWPVHPNELGDALGGLRWWWWHADEPASGWELTLAVEDPHEGYAWAINARDAT
jgi:hypothetical protein